MSLSGGSQPCSVGGSVLRHTGGPWGGAGTGQARARCCPPGAGGDGGDGAEDALPAPAPTRPRRFGSRTRPGEGLGVPVTPPATMKRMFSCSSSQVAVSVCPPCPPRPGWGWHPVLPAPVGAAAVPGGAAGIFGLRGCCSPPVPTSPGLQRPGGLSTSCDSCPSPNPSLNPNPGPNPSADAGCNPHPSSSAGCNPNPSPGPNPSADAGCSPSPSPSSNAGCDPNPSPNPGSGATRNPNPSPNPGSGATFNPNPSPNPGSGATRNPNPSPNPGSGATRNPNPSPNPGSGLVPAPVLVSVLALVPPPRTAVQPARHSSPNQPGRRRQGHARGLAQGRAVPGFGVPSAPSLREHPMCHLSPPQVESWTKQDQKLLEAVERGDVGRVAALAARKTARPAKLNAVGQSAFHLAASRGLTECLTLLLAHGAPVNERNDDGSTALHLATIACQPQCVKVLLQYGANEDHVDAQNRTPLHWAASSGCASSVLLLCDHEALLDVTDAQGQTPLMLAARGNHAAICAQLLQRGADPSLGDKDNKTALALAREHGSRDSAELLLRHGAAAGDRHRRHRAGGTAENGAGAPQGEETPGSDSEEEEEDEEQRVRRLRERLARKRRECRRLAKAADTIRQRVRELALLLPGCGAAAGTEDEDEDGACLALLEQLRKRMVAEEEEDGGHQAAAWRDGDDGTPALAPFLSWLGDECAKLRAMKATAVTRSKGLRREVEEALRSKLHYEVVSAAAVRKSLAAWEKLVAGLERALGCADDTHAEMLRGSRVLLEKLRREESWAGTELSQSPATNVGPSQSPVTNMGPSQSPATNVGPSQSPATNVGPSQSLTPNMGPSQSPVTNMGPSQSLVTNMGPSQSLTPNMGPSQSPATNVGPSQSLVTNMGPSQSLVTNMGPSQSLTPNMGPSQSPATNMGPSQSLTPNMGPSQSPVTNMGPSQSLTPNMGPSQSPATNMGPSQSPATNTEGVNVEKELEELKESNGMLLGELVRLGRERERLQEELRGLRERERRAKAAREGSGMAALARELVALRDGVGQRVREAGGDGGAEAGVLRELHRKLDGLVRSQQEALQLIAEMEGDGPHGDGDGTHGGGTCGGGIHGGSGGTHGGGTRGVGTRGDGIHKGGDGTHADDTHDDGGGTHGDGICGVDPHGSGDGTRRGGGGTHGDGTPGGGNGTHGDTGAGLLAELEAALGKLVEELGTAPGPHAQQLLERLSVTVTALRGRERPGDSGNAERWRAAATRAQEEVTAVAAARERELQDKVSGLERSLGTLRARAGQLASACRDKDTTTKKLLVETEKLSAEVLGLRGQNARLQLQLEVQEKNHRDIVAVYRTHLLHAAQGFMDEGVHAMLLRILRTGEWGAGSGPLPSPPPSH
ncbi:ankyrin repeat domain-containing protein 35 [Caloenas nicobarica]|uniref:ankyrin repeat domain-containing protein 35 n=1 Tax=Caloenas nicobarica TaxID=187106 RepID=UPI0032B74A51